MSELSEKVFALAYARVTQLSQVQELIREAVPEIEHLNVEDVSGGCGAKVCPEPARTSRLR